MQLQQLHGEASPSASGDITLASVRPAPLRAAEYPTHRTGATWATALIVFSGAGHDLDLAAQLRMRGFAVVAVDTDDGGASHDVLRRGLGDSLVARVARGDFDVVFIATPCKSYSVAHRPRLRSRRQPLGMASIPTEWQPYLDKHNKLAELTARLIRAAHDAHAAWALENPSDRGDRASHAWWSRYPDHAPIWLTPSVRGAIQDSGGHTRTFAQCSFGSAVQKYTSVAHSSDLDPHLAALDDLWCRHGRERHPELAHGRTEAGASRAAIAAAYPLGMNIFIAEALAARTRDRRTERAPTRAVGLSEGRVADGHRLGPIAASACEAARHTPPRFASARNHIPASLDSLCVEAMPGELQDLPHRTMPCGAHDRRRRAATALPDPPEASGVAALRAARITAGPIAVEQLYLDGVYEAEIASWLALADTGVAAIRDGRIGAPVPTRTVTQLQMQPWARGVVWHCGDPLDCRPVARSTRATVFRGVRQINRPALRRIAAGLGWHDDDIVAQAGEGGVEVRSQCALDTVLSFHHGGLREAVSAAATVVENDWREEWADRPVRHLPFVPCRVLPRNVIMQERSRLVASPTGGAPTLELYMKPRVTQDSSAGGEHAVNAGVADVDRYVLLPTVQQHARGLAVCDTAGGDEARAASYVVDAESAYRFCPVQEADLWTQCFLWWDAAGTAGVCVDRRLGFGGAFAPNRFERISTLVAAHIQGKLAAFDAGQPTLPSVRRWSAVRRSLQAEGRLPPCPAQLHPRYIQVYIDDFAGAALDDPVGLVSGADDIVLDPRQVASEGGSPAALGTRIYAHAQLAVLGLRDVGLSAAPGKVVAGDPVINLGLRVSRAARRVDCPPLKRTSMLADIASQRLAATDGLRVERKLAERLVGRMCNLSQVMPEIMSLLHGGYAVSQSTWETGGRRRRPPTLSLAASRSSSAYTNWLTLLDVGSTLIEANSGVELAPARAFPHRDAPGSLTVVTDASGIDGVGGYAFDASAPNTVWLVAETWPPDIQRALDAAAAEGDGAGKRRWGLSMPAAELFGAFAVAAAVAEARGEPPRAVIAVGDCEPAAAAINAATSGNPQMRRLLSEIAGPVWLAVSVPREANVDADRLSHPARLPDVRADARAAGLVVQPERGSAPIPARAWLALRAAAGLGV